MSYTYQATVTVPAPTGGPHSNFTFLLKGSDTKLRLASLGTGGAIQNSTTRSYTSYTQTVPADLVLSTDAAITSLMSWGIDNWDSANGVVWIWVKITSYSAGFTIYVSIGNSLVTTYQGGSIGSEFDANVQGDWHFPDGSTLALADFSQNTAANGGTGVNTPTAGTGQIDGAASLASASSQYVTVGTSSTLNPAAQTVSAWVNAASFPGAYNTVWSRINTASTSFQQLFIKSNGKIAVYLQGTAGVNYDGTGSNTLLANTWYYVAFTYSSTDGLVGYVNGSSDHTAAANGALASAAGVTASIGQDIKAANRPWNGSIDEVRISSVARSAAWIATEYANQSSPPSIGAFSPISSGVAPTLTLLGCQ